MVGAPRVLSPACLFEPAAIPNASVMGACFQREALSAHSAPATSPALGTHSAPATRPAARAPAELGAGPPGTADLELSRAKKGADFSFAGQEFQAKIVDYYDGDTVRVVFRHGGVLVQYRARMAGYDSPEMRPPLGQPDRLEEIKAAKTARTALAKKVGPSGLVIIRCGKWDKYGRILVTAHAGGVDLNQWMVDCGHGVSYDGGTKKPFSPGALQSEPSAEPGAAEPGAAEPGSALSNSEVDGLLSWYLPSGE